VLVCEFAEVARGGGVAEVGEGVEGHFKVGFFCGGRMVNFLKY
jgi:hypothetical protein